jgi:phosphoribosylglycinamide formyltransferase-1
VPVHDDDTEETLATRILKEEHKIYPQAIQLFAEGKIEIKGRKVRIKN